MDPAPLLEHRKVFKASVQTKYDCSAERNAELAQRAKLVRFKPHLASAKQKKNTQPQGLCVFLWLRRWDLFG